MLDHLIRLFSGIVMFRFLEIIWILFGFTNQNFLEFLWFKNDPTEKLGEELHPPCLVDQ